MRNVTRLLLIVVSLAISLAATAASVLDGKVTSVSAPSWRIDGLEFELQLTDAGLGAATRIARITLLESGDSFDDIVVLCERVAISNVAVACAAATFTVTLPAIGRQTLQGSFRYASNSGKAEVTLAGVAVAGSTLRIEIVAVDDNFDLRFSGADLQLDGLLQIANELGADFGDYSVAGNASATGRVRSVADGELRIELASDFSGTAIANASGTIATDNLGGRLKLDYTTAGAGARFDLSLESDAGEAYFEPVYANFGEHGMRLRAEQVTTRDFSTFRISAFDLLQESLLQLRGDATIRLADEAAGLPANLSGNITLSDTSVATIYSSLLQVAMAGTVLGDLETAGTVSGSVVVADSALSSATLSLADLVLDDRQGRFAVYGLHGDIDWPGSSGKVAAASSLRWDSGLVYSIALGAASVDFRLGDDDIELLAPLRLPSMGGALLVRQLQLHDYGTPAATGLLDAELEPIRIGQLAGAFGWPAFSGTLSGRLPLLQLAGETATIGGTLSANAFDGDIQISGLRIEQPFGLVPRLFGDVHMHGLDLRRLTEAFSFGLIQGRLSGDVTGLHLENWQPVAMDMHFYTPAGDKSQRRISQRAVEDLANVGGGGAAAILSSGMLRYFEVFAYEKIGLRCVLRDNVCAMSGAGSAKQGPAGQGFYIVKGSGVPRIDVVGFRNQVSWPRLVRQLAAITSSGSPTLN